MSIAEIIDRERKRAFGFTDDRRCLFTYGDFRRLLTEIESAAKREELRWAKANGELARMIDLQKVQVGNAAALREALEKCVDLILRFGNAELIETPLDVIIDIEMILKDALRAAPAKNGDEMPDIDKLTMNDLAKSPCKSTLECASREELLALVRWLLAPAAERKGEDDDESKLERKQ